VAKIIFLLFLYSCSQVSSRKPSLHEPVDVEIALDHIKASYMRGCVEAFKELNVPISFENCRDKAEFHQNEVREIMDQLPLN